MTIHWCGTGLSAVPGLRSLIEKKHRVCVWNRTIEKAQDAVGDLNPEIRQMDPEQIRQRLEKDDILVSMLPGDWHVPLAKIAIEKGAHFVSSSYIAPEMRALEDQAKAAGVALVNEIGLDPGIDHLMAHKLVADYKASSVFDPEMDITFRSYCGGIPMTPNAFCYKFSWSPLGVLKALKSPSKSIKRFSTHDVARPWDDVTSYTAPLETKETFQVYPNRDSLPFMADYGFEPGWKVKEFVRGTLRPNGWTDAWAEIFSTMQTLVGTADEEKKLTALSDSLWQKYSYDDGELDRVVLVVELMAQNGETDAYHKSYVLDAWGDARSTAMARLVSIPVSLAVEAVAQNKFAPGVHAATNDPVLVDHFLNCIQTEAQYMRLVNFLTA